MSKLKDAALLESLKESVEKVRSSFAPDQGVKLLYSDVASLSAPFWTVGLNPGGKHTEADQWCRENGAHDYRDGYLRPATAKLRPGGIALRKQLDAMVNWLGIDWTEILSLNLVPFRSASWARMPPDWRRRALRFATESFWPLLLEHRQPSLIVCFGHEAASVLRFRELLHHGQPEAFSVGWGNVTADVTASASSTILRLPHLSTFRIFNRSEGRGVTELARLRAAPALVAALAKPATLASS